MSFSKIALIPATNSSPLGIICFGGNSNPYLPVSLISDVNAYLVPRVPLYQSSEAPAAGSKKRLFLVKNQIHIFSQSFSLTKICRVNRIKPSSVNLIKSLSCIFSQFFLWKKKLNWFHEKIEKMVHTYDFLIVFWIFVVTIAIGPKPQLGITMNTMTKDRSWVQGFNVSFHILRFGFRKCCWSQIDISTFIIWDTRL